MIRYLILVFAMVLIVEATITKPLLRHRYSMAIRRAGTEFPFGLLKMGTQPDFGSGWDDQTKVQLERGEHMAAERHGNRPPAA